MGRSAALFALPCRRPENEGTPAVDAATLAAQCLTDLLLAEQVERALRATGHAPLRAIEVTACGGVVILRGRVHSYYLKQLAQAAARAVPGVQELRNDLEVIRPS
jgi:osmotically-inducible protein OsmY